MADAPSSANQLTEGVEDWSSENLDEVVLRELEGTTDVQGRPLRIVYRNGAVVDAVALEELCDKVRMKCAHEADDRLCTHEGIKMYAMLAKSVLRPPITPPGLTAQVRWPRRPLNRVEAALANSYLVATLTLEPATDDEAASSSGSSSSVAALSTSGRLVGLARCTR